MQVLNTAIRRDDAMIVRQVFLGEALEMRGANRFYLLAVQTDVVHHNRVQAGRDDGDRRLLVCSIHDTVTLFACNQCTTSTRTTSRLIVPSMGERTGERNPLSTTTYPISSDLYTGLPSSFNHMHFPLHVTRFRSHDLWSVLIGVCFSLFIRPEIGNNSVCQQTRGDTRLKYLKARKNSL